MKINRNSKIIKRSVYAGTIGSGLIATIYNFTSILGFLGISPNADNKDDKTTINNSTINIYEASPSRLKNNQKQNKEISQSDLPNKPTAQTNLKNNELEIINSSFVNTSSPVGVAFIIKADNTFSTDLASLTSGYLTEQGVESNAAIFKQTVINNYAMLRSPNKDIIEKYKLDKYCNWYLIGETKSVEKPNKVNPSDKTCVVTFNGFLVGVSQQNLGKQYKISHTEREAGEEGLVTDKTNDKMAQKLAVLIKEKIAGQ